jgi:hypothetical protein
MIKMDAFSWAGVGLAILWLMITILTGVILPSVTMGILFVSFVFWIMQYMSHRDE